MSHWKGGGQERGDPGGGCCPYGVQTTVEVETWSGEKGPRDTCKTSPRVGKNGGTKPLLPGAVRGTQ